MVWAIGCRSLSVCQARLGRFKWYNIRKRVDNEHQADPTYFEQRALALEPKPGYIDRLGEIWLEMVATSRDVNFKRDDFFINKKIDQWLPKPDDDEPLVDYKNLEELNNAPESVKRIFSVKYGRRKDLTDWWKAQLLADVRKHDLDNDSLETRIAKHTALVRHWTTLLNEMKQKPGWLRQCIFISIQHRRKLLRLLREEDKQSFANVLQRLKIAYYTPPLPEDQPPFTRKGWIEYIAKKKVDLVKEEKLRRYDEELKERRQQFIEEKRKALAQYQLEKESIHGELDKLRLVLQGQDLVVVGEYPGHTVDQVSEDQMFKHYYMPAAGQR